MAATTDGFAAWLAQAHIPEQRLTAEQRALLQGAFRFRGRQGDDYYANRLLSHFLLHCGCGLKVAQIARLVGISRPTASHQQGRSSKEVIQAAHHRLAGRPYGKLLPRYAGPVAEFLLTHADASRYDVLDFIQRTFDVRVSTVALHHFLKKYGLDRASRQAARPPADPPACPDPVERPSPRDGAQAPRPAPRPAPPLSRRARSTRAPSCCCPRRWTGWPRRRRASRTSAARSARAC
jgi:transposase